MTRLGPAREVVLLIGLYLAYSCSRLLADGSLEPAIHRADSLVAVEHVLGLAWEHPLNRLFVEVDAIGLPAAYWYAAAHYVVTAIVLGWLWHRGAAAYVPARRALMLATVAALALYLLLPMAPPRLVPGYTDVLDLHAAAGWWGGEASAPRGLGGLTNQLAAFPSMHAGWALWVALATHGTRWQRLGWIHALVTAVVVVGTGNHWVLDVLVGWLVVLAAAGATGMRTGPDQSHEDLRSDRSSLADAVTRS